MAVFTGLLILFSFSSVVSSLAKFNLGISELLSFLISGAVIEKILTVFESSLQCFISIELNIFYLLALLLLLALIIKGLRLFIRVILHCDNIGCSQFESH